MKYAESALDPKVEKELHEQIELFLNEFMFEEYKGGQHIVAREHYSKVFHDLLPKYMQLTSLIICRSATTADAEEVLK